MADELEQLAPEATTWQAGEDGVEVEEVGEPLGQTGATDGTDPRRREPDDPAITDAACQRRLPGLDQLGCAVPAPGRSEQRGDRSPGGEEVGIAQRSIAASVGLDGVWSNIA